MEAFIVFLFCAIAAANAQLINPISTLGIGPGLGNPMWHSGMRYPGIMQSSQLSSMTYPTWRSHPLFRMVPSVSEKNMGSNLPADVINIPKVPSSQEVLTHLALATQNSKPYFDTMSDLLYDPQKARTVVTSVTPGASMPSLPITSAGSVGPVTPITSVASLASMASPYLQGINLMRTVPNVGEDCGPQESARWERGTDWLY